MLNGKHPLNSSEWCVCVCVCVCVRVLGALTTAAGCVWGSAEAALKTGLVIHRDSRSPGCGLYSAQDKTFLHECRGRETHGEERRSRVKVPVEHGQWREGIFDGGGGAQLQGFKLESFAFDLDCWKEKAGREGATVTHSSFVDWWMDYSIGWIIGWYELPEAHVIIWIEEEKLIGFKYKL